MAVETTDVWLDLINLTKERGPHYTELWEYFQGSQDLPLDPTELNTKFGQTFAQFRDNLARPIVEAAEGRVRIKQIGEDTGNAEDANEIWKRNRMQRKHKLVHNEAMVKGDGFVIVLPDEDGDAAIWPQISEQCAILYSDVNPDKKEAAIKWWVQDMVKENGVDTEPFVRVNIYTDTHIERYISTSSTSTLDPDFSKYREYGDEEVPWRTRHQAKEVPMFQFSPNYDLSLGRGVSDLEDSLGFIDLITKTFLDMAVASEFTAAPQRWATGIEIPLDPKTGEPLQTFKAGADNLWTAANDAAKFGQFQAGSLSAFETGIKAMVEHLAVVSRTPMYMLLAQEQWPSGEMLKTTEAGLRQRVADHQEDFTPTWQDVMVCAMRLDDIELEEVEEKEEVNPDWLPANAPFATLEHLEELKTHVEVLGIPEEMAWRKAGYTQDEIEEMLAMREEEAALGVDVAADLQAQAILDGQLAQEPEGQENGLTPDTPVTAETTVDQPPQ